MSTDVNVKVAVRCRPMRSRETQMGARGVVQVLDGTTVVIYPNADAEAAREGAGPHAGGTGVCHRAGDCGRAVVG